jgi:hypothetical protein
MNVVCPRCQGSMHAPDDLAQTLCVHCGQLLSLAETHVTAGPPASSAVQATEPEPWAPGRSAPGQVALPETYANWDEFRTLSPALQGELIKLAVRALPDLREAELQTLPATLPPKVDEFGLPLATLMIPGEKQALNFGIAALAAVIGGIFLLAGGFELSGRRLQPLMRDGVAAYSILMLVGMVGVGFGAWHAFFRHPNLSITLWIFENGLFLQRGNEVEACGWEDVKDFRDAENTGPPAYTIITRGDCRLILSAAQAPTIMPLAEYLKVKVASAQFLPKLQRIFNGDPVKFGALWVDSTGIKGAITATWSEIVRVVADDASVYIDCRGLDTWQQIPLRSISFPLLLLAIAHVMIEDAKRLPVANE